MDRVLGFCEAKEEYGSEELVDIVGHIACSREGLP
jgi:hypothetical protein